MSKVSESGAAPRSPKQMALRAAAVDALREARARIARGWCQGDYAVDAAGYGVAIHELRATRWCSDGAIWIPQHENDWPYRYLRAAIGVESITWWNDRKTRTHEEVVAAFDKAIALAEAEPAHGEQSPAQKDPNV